MDLTNFPNTLLMLLANETFESHKTEVVYKGDTIREIDILYEITARFEAMITKEMQENKLISQLNESIKKSSDLMFDLMHNQKS